jgi:hypothetical protein
MKMSLLFALMAVLCSCGGGSKSAKLANEICDCYRKANGMDANDPNRSKEQDKCLALQGTAWQKVRGNKEKEEEFNRIIGECSAELIKNAFQPK